MPAAACEAPLPGAGSRTVTVSPRSAACQAMARPITPPPTTTTSVVRAALLPGTALLPAGSGARAAPCAGITRIRFCLLYTSDAADEEDSVDLGGRRIINKKQK